MSGVVKADFQKNWLKILSGIVVLKDLKRCQFININLFISSIIYIYIYIIKK